jgi:hypothetical protein
MKFRVVVLAVACAIVVHAAGGVPARGEDPRTASHAEYAKKVWDEVQKQYKNWAKPDEPIQFPFEMARHAGDAFYLNSKASGNTASSMPPRSVVVQEHYCGEGDELLAVTVYVRGKPGFDPARDDWYIVNYLTDGTVVKTSADKSLYSRPGFVTFEEDGRLWVFRVTSPELADFLSKGELAKHAIRPSAGPSGMTIKGPDGETISRYLFAKPGFFTRETEDGRLWVIRLDAEELSDFMEKGELAKHSIRVAAGPNGMTLKAPDTETITRYLYAKPGFVVRETDEGRLWVFREGAEELAAFQESGELAKHAIRPGAGPNGVTLKAPDTETIDAYLYGAPGFATALEDGRLWVFRDGSEALEGYRQEGAPEKHTTRPGAGPLGVTVKGPDPETIEAYLRAVSS